MTTRHAACRQCGITALRGHIWGHQAASGHRGIDASTEDRVDHRSIALALEGKGFTYIPDEVAAILDYGKESP